MRGDEPSLVNPASVALYRSEFPACAGMNRRRVCVGFRSAYGFRVPRMRGDEPLQVSLMAVAMCRTEFPACAGMNRGRSHCHLS